MLLLGLPSFKLCSMCKHTLVGLTRTLYIQYFWQGIHQRHGHTQCAYIQFWPTLHTGHVCNTVISSSMFVFNRRHGLRSKLYGWYNLKVYQPYNLLRVARLMHDFPGGTTARQTSTQKGTHQQSVPLPKVEAHHPAAPLVTQRSQRASAPAAANPSSYAG